MSGPDAMGVEVTTQQTNRRESWSGRRAERDDRLVRRFTTSGRLHVHMRLGGRSATHSRPVVAEVTDVSITGMLLTVSGGLRVRPGALLTLGDGESTAVCRVVHVNTPAGSRSQRLGVEILDQTAEFRSELNLAVGALRKDVGQVRAAWERPN